MPPVDYHIPVMVKEVTDFLVTNPEGIYVDATTGGGGHSRAILSVINDRGKVLGFDLDSDALEYASRRNAEFENYRLFNMGFDQVDFVLDREGIKEIDGIVYDLGISSYQIDEEHKGFAFRQDSPLDMRFSQFQDLTAERVVNDYEEERLIKIFREYGEERRAVAIARAIVERRGVSPLQSTGDLVGVIESVTPFNGRKKSLARIFQSIRIEVNNELERLSNSLEKVLPYLKVGGRLVVISYHSLEDRIVKNFFKEKSTACICPPEFPVCRCDHKKELNIITRKVVVPTEDEVNNNPRARSAKLRVAEKVES